MIAELDALQRAMRDLSDRDRQLLAHLAGLLPHIWRSNETLEIRCVGRQREADHSWQVSRIRRTVQDRRDWHFGD